MKLRAEKEGHKVRFEKLRAQNESIVKEVAGLKVKFSQSMQLLRKYQVRARLFPDGVCVMYAHVCVRTSCLWVLFVRPKSGRGGDGSGSGQEHPGPSE